MPPPGQPGSDHPVLPFVPPGEIPLSKGLHRSLGFWSALAITVGTMIGTGIYLKPGEVAAQAGSVEWAVLAWLAGGFLSLAGALVYLELAAEPERLA